MADLTIWMPLYIGDFLADTARLNTEEIGALVLLRLDYFRNGPGPADERILRQITRLGAGAWSNAWKMLQPLFVQADDGKLHNKSWDAEMAGIAEKRSAATAKAAKAAYARWKKDAQDTATSIFQAKRDSSQSQSYPKSETEISNTNTLAFTDGTVPAESAFIALPLKDGTEFSILQKQIDDWKVLFPTVDVEQAVSNYKAWAKANPAKQKARTGILSSVVSWLKNEQDKFKRIGESNGVNKKTSVADAKRKRSRAAIQKASQHF